MSILATPAHARTPRELRRRVHYGKFAGSAKVVEKPLPKPELGFFKPGDIVYDRQFPPNEGLRRRQMDDSSTASRTSPPILVQTTGDKEFKFHSTATAMPASITSGSSNSADSAASAAGPAPTLVTDSGVSEDLPTPLDSGLGNNYTQPNCPVFVQSMLDNSTFSSCMPLSLLLQVSRSNPNHFTCGAETEFFLQQNSMSFFSATKTMAGITDALDASCHVVAPICSSVMTSYASQLREDGNCGDDYDRQNPLIVSVYNGLTSYEPLYEAGCEKDSKGNYCFADAITNTSSPTDPYIYYLPVGIALPGGSRPTCNSCLKRTMSVFYNAAKSKSHTPLSSNYVAAAQMITLGCGPGFVNDTLPDSGGGADSSATHSFSSPCLSKVGLASMVALVSVFATMIPFY
ncbi:MAG: hypothetical protein Q9190_003378 [Brigantiaea leucoxantha]